MRWSFSAYDAYGTCARRFYEIKILKNYIEPEGEAALWGTKVHEALEFRVRDGVPLPEGMTQWEPLAAKLAAAPGAIHCELRLGIRKDLTPCDFDAEDVWCRGIVDYATIAGVKALALDYKTGKRKLTDQLVLMALLLFAHYPALQDIATGFIWLKDNCHIDKQSFKRSEMGTLWRRFLPRLQEMRESEKLGIYPAKQGGLCKNWCVVASCCYHPAYRAKRNDT